ncbi:uncharacterized protein LOC120351622 [Nilaparvata lugens]|uniref:uncharacterized protein LOC120351622 n=1 Tax=Nilaparvata lugens TaxID=108931 RepID=UPI00193DB825|nr:uncharacterized protein LOC120351622 [Nilaparvata lugens]
MILEKKLKEKKLLFKRWQGSKTQEDREKFKLEYKLAKKAAKRAVAQAKAASEQDFYTKIETTKDSKLIFKTAKQRHNNCQDIRMVKFIKNEEGQLLTKDEDIRKRWKEYYCHLLNEEFPIETLQSELPTMRPIPSISEEEVRVALHEMATNKAVGPDEIPVEVWKMLNDTGVKFITGVFNAVLSEGIPDEWRRSYIVPFYKNKGDVRLCRKFKSSETHLSYI